jgi:hypothetical protein
MRQFLSAIFSTGLLFSLWSPFPALAHGEGGHEKKEPAVVVDTPEPEGISFLLEYDEAGNRVGTLNPFRGRLVDSNGESVHGKMDVDLSVVHLEDDHPILQTRLSSLGGSLLFQNQFFDGSDHKLVLQIRSGDDPPRFAPFTKERVVEVTAVQPPLKVIAKTLFLLVGTIAFGIGAGWVVGNRFMGGGT